MNLKTKVVIGVILLSMIVLVIACSPRSRGSSETNILIIWAASDSNIDPLVAQFQAENPQWDVRLTKYGWNDLHVRFIAGLSNPERNLPDVMTTPARTVGEFSILGGLEPVTEYKAQLGLPDTEWIPGVWDYFDAPGPDDVYRHYAIPGYWDGRAIFYRSDLYNAAGVGVGRTWDEFKANAARVGNGDTVFGIGSLSGGIDTHWFQSILYSHGGRLNTPDGRTSLLDSPPALTALRYYQSIYFDNIAPRDPARRAGDPFVAFQQGYYATVHAGPWWFALIAADPQLEGRWEVAPVPTVTQGAARAQYAHPNPWILPVGAQNKAGAYAWLNFMQRPEAQAEWFELSGNLPVRLASYNLNLAKGNRALENAIAVMLASGDYGYFSERNIANANLIRNDAVIPMLDSVKNGEDVLVATRRAVDVMNRLLNDR